MWKKLIIDNDYEINDYGLIKSYKKYKEGKILKQTLDNIGYVRYCLYINGKQEHHFASVLVWDHFGNERRNKKQVDHIDENKTNNHIDNLQLLTPRENKNKGMKKYKTTSKYDGVYWQKGLNKWRSRINVGKEGIHIGVFDDEYDAHLSYQKKLKEINGFKN